MELKDDYFPETPFSRERLLAKAEEIAEFLTGKGDVEKVGIAGSLARGRENPTDIDIVLFVNEGCAMSYYLGQVIEAFGNNYEEDYTSPDPEKKEHAIQKIGLENKQLVRLLLTLFNEEAEGDSSLPPSYPIDWIIVSSNPSDPFINLSTIMNFDPDFLRQLSKDVLTYNPKTKKFEKEPYLDDHQREVLRNATTKRLKNLINDEKYAKLVKKSPSHQKRVQRARGN